MNEEIETGVSHIAYFRIDGGSPKLYTQEYVDEKDKEIERLNNIINELKKDIKNLYTYGIKNNAEQRDYLLNRLEGLKEYKGADKE